jgi:uncharacterized protein YkwD
MLLAAAPGLPFLLDSAFLTTEDLRSIEQHVYQNVNQERSSFRLPELNWNEQLADEARRHANRIANGRFFAHQDPMRGDIDRRLNISGIKWSRCAENLYEGNRGDLPKEAVKAWLQSSGHRKNMLDSVFSETGIGAAVRPDMTIVIVQEFIFR